MIWPPAKAWTSNTSIKGQRHFVAINYGGNLLNRWVDLISVVDGSLVLKVSWSQLCDQSKWNCGWDVIHNSDFSERDDKHFKINTNIFPNLSIDSGLTVPITKKKIRPWFFDP